MWLIISGSFNHKGHEKGTKATEVVSEDIN